MLWFLVATGHRLYMYRHLPLATSVLCSIVDEITQLGNWKVTYTFYWQQCLNEIVTLQRVRHVRYWLRAKSEVTSTDHKMSSGTHASRS